MTLLWGGEPLNSVLGVGACAQFTAFRPASLSWNRDRFRTNRSLSLSTCDQHLRMLECRCQSKTFGSFDQSLPWCSKLVFLGPVIVCLLFMNEWPLFGASRRIWGGRIRNGSRFHKSEYSLDHTCSNATDYLLTPMAWRKNDQKQSAGSQMAFVCAEESLPNLPCW